MEPEVSVAEIQAKDGKNIKQSKNPKAALRAWVRSCSVDLCTVKTSMADTLSRNKEPEGAKGSVALPAQKNCVMLGDTLKDFHPSIFKTHFYLHPGSRGSAGVSPA